VADHEVLNPKALSYVCDDQDYNAPVNLVVEEDIEFHARFKLEVDNGKAEVADK